VSRREIVEIGHPALRQRARELTPDELRSDGVQRLIDDMVDTMRAANGPVSPPTRSARRCASR